MEQISLIENDELITNAKFINLKNKTRILRLFLESTSAIENKNNTLCVKKKKKNEYVRIPWQIGIEIYIFI